MLLDEMMGDRGGKAASMAYWNALAALRSAWKQVFNEDLPTEGNNARDAYRQALDLVTKRLSSNARDARRLRSELDIGDDQELGEALLNFADLDDIPPNEVKASIYRQSAELGDGRHELRYLLRLVLDEIFEDRRQKQARVGANRHWPRLLLYLREIEDETDWGDNNRGLRLINASGRGPVAAEPEDPLRLAIRVDTNFF